jgi:nucleoid-associated protein YgaU
MADDKSAAPPPAAAAANNPYTQTHTVVAGDTLSKIAEKYYGDASLYPQIFQANRDVLSDPNKISIGQKLRIP